MIRLPSFRDESEQRLPWRVSLTVAGVSLLSLAVILALGWWATSAVDEEALGREVGFARQGLADQFNRIPKDQESGVIWDEAVHRVRADDQTWMATNLGEWMGEYFGHNQVFVLDPDNRPVHAMLNGSTVAAVDAYERDAETIAPLVSAMRKQIADGGDRITDLDEAPGFGVEDYILLHGRPAIVSIKPIVPDTEDLFQPPGSEYLHISVRFLDPSFVKEIADNYQLTAAQVLLPGASVPPSSVPVVTASGETLAYLAWTPYSPGLSMIRTLGPPAALAALPIVALLVWLVRHLWRSTRRLHDLAFHDYLTTLPNRTLFNLRLRSMLEAAARSGRPVAMMMIDIDRFKNVNDTLGHPIGDELIRQMAGRLKLVVGDSGLLARLGGDEFAVILDRISSDADAERVAESILFEMQRPFVLSGEQITAGVSIGSAVAHGQSDASDLLRRADIALYEAKSRGRRRHQLFFPELSDIVLRRRAIEQDLRLALEDGSITAAYQPIFDTSVERVVGAEALVRWNHPVHGALAPDVFIGIAEERGLIDQLGERMLELVCQLLRETTLPWVAVNLSPVQLRNADFADATLRSIERLGVEPDRIQFEIREATLIADDATIIANLGLLRARGVKVALDDFGTGYSSVNYLRQYPVDKIKIDRTLVDQVLTSRECEAITRAIVSLAKSLGKTVAAEGVESAEIRAVVAAIGCDELQGYALARPLSHLQLRSQFGELWELPPGVYRGTG
ncbi:MAG: EAL domain-containing protein [Bauldia sp.]|nr:EAL domain-containing protein [Bauldia sp.]